MNKDYKFGELIKAKLKETNKTEEWLLEKCNILFREVYDFNIYTSNLVKWFYKLSWPSTQQAKEIADLFNVDAKEFLEVALNDMLLAEHLPYVVKLNDKE